MKNFSLIDRGEVIQLKVSENGVFNGIVSLTRPEARLLLKRLMGAMSKEELAQITLSMIGDDR